MANREKVRSVLLRLCCVLLLTGLVTASAHAQSETLASDIPVSSGFTASLTDDPQTAPVTTLSIDLLAPQRPYIFDPSGASVTSNALNPEIYSSSFNSSLVETDTQIRDSSQTGQINPYAAAAQRLGLSFSGGGVSGGQDNLSTSNGSFHSAVTGEIGSGLPAAGDAYQSSWGVSSSFAPQSEESSWSTRRLGVNRLGNQQPNPLAETTGAKGDLATAGDSNGYALGSADGYSATADGRSSGRSSIGRSKGKSTNSFASRYAGSRTNGSANGSIDARAGSTYSENKPGQYLIRGKAGNGSAGSTMNGASRDRNDSAKNSLTFFPQAIYSQSSLGESPFSSPDGVDELHFLNPNIYAATPQGHSLSSKTKASAPDDSLREAFVQRDHLAPSASHYGLNTHPGAEGSAKGNDNFGLEKYSHLSTGLPDSKNP